MSVSHLEAGAYVPTPNRFRMLLRLRRPHKASSRPPCRPSPGAVEAGEHGGGRSKRKGPPRVEKRATKRGERQFFPYFNDTISHFIHKYMCRYLGHVVSAIEKSGLDQVLSRKRPRSKRGPPFGMVFARRASPCSFLSTLLGAASTVLASSPGNGFCSCFFVKISKRIFVRTGTYQSRSTRNIVG